MKIIQLVSFALALFANCTALHYPNYTHHECKRTCVNGQQMTCSYNFTVENMMIQTPECGNCPRNETDCFYEQCLVADGGNNQAIVINRLLPGPMIEVCEGDIIEVLFANNLIEQVSSIHWHGIHQKGSQYMDGVPMITQCPTLADTTFTYRFKAEPKGTHFYHSHYAFQRNTGSYGALIVKTPPSDSDRKLYDYQLSEHVITLAAWMYEKPIVPFETDVVSTILVNGIGSTVNNSLPIQNFTVEKGHKYRFRFIHAGYIMCQIQIQIEKHNMTVISTDGQDVEPFIADTIHLTNGERVDVVISANQPADYYWIKFSGGIACRTKESVAFLKYKSTDLKSPARSNSPMFLPARRQLNCLNTFSSDSTCTFYHQLKYRGVSDNLDLKPNADITYYIGYTTHTSGNPTFESYNSATFNNITMIMPKRPLIFGETGLQFCNNETKSKTCDPKVPPCMCIHVVKFPMNKTVEIVLVDEGTPYESMHPMHLHGYGFRVIAEERMGHTFYVDQFKKLDANNKIKRNLDNPPIKDSITPQAGGYVILRIRTNNPGYWLFQSDAEHHTEVGMSMVFKTGEVTNDPPAHFPTCGTFFGPNRLQENIVTYNKHMITKVFSGHHT